MISRVLRKQNGAYRIAVIGVLLASLLLGLAAMSSAKTTIVVHHRNVTQETAWFQAIKTEFEAAHPDIEVELISSAGGLGYSERLMLLYGSGQAPDVVFNTADKVAHLLMGLALDLTQFIERDRDELELEDFLPGSLEPWNFSGKQLSLPLMAIGSHMFVNVDHLEQAGLAPLPNTWDTDAWTWDDMIDHGKKLRRVDNQGRVVQIAVDFSEKDISPALTWLFGGDWFASEAYITHVPERIHLNTPEARAAYEAVLDLKFEHEIMPSPITEWGVSATVARFLAGQMSMYTHGGHWASTVRNSSPNFEWVMAPVPLAVNRTWRTYNDGIFVSSATKHPEEAWEFVKFATSPRGLELFAQIWGFPPARRSAMMTWIQTLSDSIAMNEAELMQQISDAMVFGRSWTDSIAFTHDIRSISSKHLIPMMDGRVPVPEALEAAEREINARLSELALAAQATEAEEATDDRTVLFIGPENNLALRALRELGFTADVVAASDWDLEEVEFSQYSIIVSGYQVKRNVLSSPWVKRPLLQAIEQGSVFIGFRDWVAALQAEQDDWLPSPAVRDGGYFVDRIEEPTHPLFNEPNKITLDMMRRIHAGSMYHPYVRLGEGWIPLVSGTQIQTGFRNNFGVPPLHDEQPHYGIVELPYGQGRIILSQFIPEYQWFTNDSGNPNSVGRLFIENLMGYAVTQSGRK